MADNTNSAERSVAHARTDRQTAGRSVETSPESLYLWQIAVLERRVATLQTRVAQKDRNLQSVIDRYETVLDEREQAQRGELLTDGGQVDESGDDSLARRALARVRGLFE